MLTVALSWLHIHLKNWPLPFLSLVLTVNALGGQQIITLIITLSYSFRPLQKCKSLPSEENTGIWIFMWAGLPVSHAWCCCINYSGGKANTVIREHDGECLFFPECSIIREHTVHTSPNPQKQTITQMYAKISTGRKAKVFKIKWLSQCRKKSGRW